MSPKRKLFYKDLDFLKFLALIPIILYICLYFLNSFKIGVIPNLTHAFSYIKIGAIEFFFFASTFLLCSLGLREHKYTNAFSLRSFITRRLLKLVPLTIPLVLFAFIIHPLIATFLGLTSVRIPSWSNGFLLAENFELMSTEQFVYIGALWFCLIFMLYSAIIGLLLKFAHRKLNIFGIILIAGGLGIRLLHLLNDTRFDFDPLAFAVPVGIGLILANYVRNEQRFRDYFKDSSFGWHLIFYVLGFLTVVLGYVYSRGSYLSLLIPLVLGFCFSYTIMAQTFSKNSQIKFRNMKRLSKYGRMSYGIIIYFSIICSVLVVAMDSLEINLELIGNQLIFLCLAVVLTFTLALLSYEKIEKPISIFKREFKKV